MKTNQNLQWIQALRGIAALMVLFFHMQPHWALHQITNLFSEIMKFGFSGVDVFFAISGFVVYKSAKITIPKYGSVHFLKQRLARVYLGYWPILFLTVVLVDYVLNKPFPDSVKMFRSFFLLYPNIWENWLPIAWSLTFELYFYLYIAIVFFFFKNSKIKVLSFTILIVIIWNATWYFFNRELAYHNGERPPLRYLLTPYIVEFAFGVFIAEIYDKNKDIFKSFEIIIPLSLTVMILGLAVGFESRLFNQLEILRVASFGIFGAAFLILILTLQVNEFKPPTILCKIGDASYSLYLIHIFLLGLSGYIRGLIHFETKLFLFLYLLVTPFVIVLVSFLWYKIIEKPIYQWANKNLLMKKSLQINSNY